MSKMKFNNETQFVFSNEFIGFTTIPNYIFNCRQISFKAIGIYCSILQFQNAPDHRISIKGLMAIHADGETSVTNGINELLEAGFLTREQIREKGKIKGYLYTVYMKPVHTENTVKNTVTVKSKNTVKNTITIANTKIAPKRDFPDTVKPDTENHVNKKKIGKKENLKKENKDDDAIINQSIINNFQNKWTEITSKRIKLTDKQKVDLMKKIIEHGEEVVFKTLEKIVDSKYLMNNIKPSKFLDAETFIKIFNGEYDDYNKPQQAHKEVTSKNVHFTTTYSHGWDLEELQRKEMERLFGVQ